MSASARAYYYAFLIGSGDLVGDEVSDPYETEHEARMAEADVVARYPLAKLARLDDSGNYRFVPAHTYDDARLDNAAEAALSNFWEGIAAAYPEVTTGDLDPLDVVRFDEMARNTVRAWLYANVPYLHSHDQDRVSYELPPGGLFYGTHAHPFEEADNHTHAPEEVTP